MWRVLFLHRRTAPHSHPWLSYPNGENPADYLGVGLKLVLNSPLKPLFLTPPQGLPGLGSTFPHRLQAP